MNEAEVQIRNCIESCRHVQVKIDFIQEYIDMCQQMCLLPEQGKDRFAQAILSTVSMPFTQRRLNLYHLRDLDEYKQNYVHEIWSRTARTICAVLPSDPAVREVVQNLADGQVFRINTAKARECIETANQSYQRFNAPLGFLLFPYVLNRRQRDFTSDLKTARRVLRVLSGQAERYLDSDKREFFNESLSMPERGLSPQALLRRFERSATVVDELVQQRLKKDFSALWRAVDDGLAKAVITDKTLKAEFIEIIQQSSDAEYVSATKEGKGEALSILAGHYDVKPRLEEIRSVSVRNKTVGQGQPSIQVFHPDL
ncbi:MAG: hypothetical protein EOM37_01965 [Proteobacteria bacterium]|jgi:hypothetical protein|nr:hypothetical protein [Alphaproteobacteria bacterium]NCC02801.1 hypothetical protein [Pseudomonadota bacterium]